MIEPAELAIANARMLHDRSNPLALFGVIFAGLAWGKASLYRASGILADEYVGLALLIAASGFCVIASIFFARRLIRIPSWAILTPLFGWLIAAALIVMAVHNVQNAPRGLKDVLF